MIETKLGSFDGLIFDSFNVESPYGRERYLTSDIWMSEEDDLMMRNFPALASYLLSW